MPILKWEADENECDGSFAGIWAANSATKDSDGGELTYCIVIQKDGLFYLDLTDRPLDESGETPIFRTLASAKEWCERREKTLRGNG